MIGWIWIKVGSLNQSQNSRLTGYKHISMQTCYCSVSSVMVQNIKLLLHQPLVTMAPRFGSLSQKTYELSHAFKNNLSPSFQD